MQGWQIENQWHHPIVMRKNDERPMMSNKLKELEILEAKVKKKSTIESKLISHRKAVSRGEMLLFVCMLTKVFFFHFHQTTYPNSL
jgi:hypothetical protein